jgi:hypothetical protein
VRPSPPRPAPRDPNPPARARARVAAPPARLSTCTACAAAGEIYVASGDLAWSFVFAGAVQLVGALTLTASIVRGGRAARARAAPDGAEKRGPAAELGLGVPPDARAPAPAHPRAVYLPLVLSASEVPVAPVLPFMFAVHRPSSDSSGVQERPDAGALGGTGGV